MKEYNSHESARKALDDYNQTASRKLKKAVVKCGEKYVLFMLVDAILLELEHEA